MVVVWDRRLPSVPVEIILANARSSNKERIASINRTSPMLVKSIRGIHYSHGTVHQGAICGTVVRFVALYTPCFDVRIYLSLEFAGEGRSQDTVDESKMWIVLGSPCWYSTTVSLSTTHPYWPANKQGERIHRL